MNEQRNLDRMAGRFVRFAAQEACDSSPLYERLSHAIADDPEILALAAHARRGQPVPNLLFAAVCLYHCYTLNQWPREARARLSELLAAHSHRRDRYRISLESHGGAYPETSAR